MGRHRRIAAAVGVLGTVTAACSAILNLEPPPEATADAAAMPEAAADAPAMPDDRSAPRDDAPSPRDAGADSTVDASGGSADASDGAPQTDANADAAEGSPTCVGGDLDAAPPDAAPGAPATYASLDAPGAWESYATGFAFSGGTFDGRFVYLGPAGSVAARFDTQSDAGFASSSSWGNTNLGTLDPNLKQFNGAAFDGRYVYLAPWGGAGTPSGVAARFDTFGGSFAADAGAWATFDTTTLDAGALAAGLEGAVFDGRFVYYVPSPNGTGVDGVVARFDTAAEAGAADAGAAEGGDAGDDGSARGGPFASAAAWSTFDLGTKEAGTSSFMGGVFDGARLYLVPRPVAAVPARLAIDAGFANPAAWTTFPVQTLLIPGTWLFGGGAFDGRYVYLVPRSTGVVLRFDTHNPAGWAPPNGSLGGWSSFDTTTILPPGAAIHPADAGEQWPYAGAGFDGRFLYVVPRGTTVLARYDTFSTFDAACAWSTFDLANVGAPAGLADYYGGAVFDGEYLYLWPHDKRVPTLRFHAKTPASMPALPAFHGSFY
jgi:hypothetical protein